MTAAEAFKWMIERMDELAMTEPESLSYKMLFAQIRGEVGHELGKALTEAERLESWLKCPNGHAVPSVMAVRCDHNLIPCSRWFRHGWICVRCHRWYRQQPPRRAQTAP